jgi:hypothetical protein
MIKGIKIAGLATLLFSTCNIVEAIPLYYTISGNISSSGQSDTAGMMQDMGLASGDTVSYTFLIDLDSEITSTWSSLSNNNFDAALVSSNIFGNAPIADGELYPAAPWGGGGSTQITNFANQHYQGEAFYGETVLAGFAPNASIQIHNEASYFADGTITQLQPGDFFSAYNSTYLYDGKGGGSHFSVDNFRIDSVSEENPATTTATTTATATATASVPEPGLLWLFGVGMIGLATRRFRN